MISDHALTNLASSESLKEFFQMPSLVKLQAHLQCFWNRWRHEYLTSLSELHRTTGTNQQSIKKGEVVLVHNDTPQPTWKLAVIESLSVSGPYLFNVFLNDLKYFS